MSDDERNERLMRMVEAALRRDEAEDPMREWRRPARDLVEWLVQQGGVDNVEPVLVLALGMSLAVSSHEADLDLERRLTLTCRLLRGIARGDDLRLRRLEIRQADAEERRDQIRLVDEEVE